MEPEKIRWSKRYDLLALVSMVLLSTIVSLFLDPPLLVVTTLFFTPPSVYILWRKPSLFKGPAVAALLFGVIWAPSFDHFATFNNAFAGTPNTLLFFPFPMFMPLDLFLLYAMQVFGIAIFYDYFIAGSPSGPISPRAARSALAGLGVLLLFVFLLDSAPDLVSVRYGYLVAGLATLAPALVILYRRPGLCVPALKTVPFFFFLYLLYELVSLHFGLWRFPGQYLGMVTLFDLHFPLEELVFWIALSSASISVYYAHFIRTEPRAETLPVR